MTASLDRYSRWLARPDIRLALFGLSAVAAVYLGFIGVPVRAAEEFVKRGGYFVMLLTFAMFLYSCWRCRETPALFPEPLTRSQRTLIVAVIAGLSLMAISAEPFRSKILNDEFVLQSTAFNMHFFRDVATMVRGYDIQGVFVSTDNYLDKRPYLYPFLVSLLHDFSGYRIANAFLVNSALMPVALALAFAFGRLLHGWRGGLIATGLLGSLPLLGQNATGSGMELLNVVMILAGLLLGTAYLQEPSEGRLAAFILAVVLLAQARYESALYVAPATLIVVFGWLRQRRVILPWAAILVPLLLLPVALQNKVLSHSPILWELTEKSAGRFDFSYFPDNIRGALAFLFATDAQLANSLTLSVLGLLALGWGLTSAIRGCRRLIDAHPGRLALACFSLAIVANTFLVFCYYWSRFNDPMASRFSLPLHLLMAFAVVLAVAEVERRWRMARGWFVVVGLFAFAGAASKYSFHYYSHLGIDEIEWQRRYVNALPPAPRVIISNESTLPWLLEQTPSILIGRARLVADRLAYQLHEPTFHEILVLQSLRPSTPEGDHQVPPEDKLPPYFRLETLAEKRFGTRLSRISRLVAVNLPADWKAPAPAASGRSKPVPSE